MKKINYMAFKRDKVVQVTFMAPLFLKMQDQNEAVCRSLE
jgi:hypothetical protein